MHSNIDEYIYRIVTKQEAAGVLSALEILREAVYKTGANDLNTLLDSEIGVGLAQAVKADLAASPDEYKDPANISGYFKYIEAKVKSIPVVELEMAFDPTRNFLVKVRDNLSGYLKQQILVGITVNPLVIGGATITYQGHWADFSLATKWDEVWQEIENRLR